MNKWHDWLDMKRHDKQWHINDIHEEVTEYLEETNIIKKWSELSDVAYTYTRSKWAGYNLSFPFKKWQYYLGLIYMYPKYTDRWLFFRYAGRKAGSQSDLHEVRNPNKTHKLHHIAIKNNLDPIKFQLICEKLLRVWPLLP